MIVGAVVGAVVGAALVLVLVIFVVKRRQDAKKKKAVASETQTPGNPGHIAQQVLHAHLYACVCMCMHMIPLHVGQQGLM